MVFLTSYKADGVENEMNMDMLCIFMGRIHDLIQFSNFKSDAPGYLHNQFVGFVKGRIESKYKMMETDS